MKTEEFNFSNFTRVDVGGAFEVEVVQSDSFSVSITADDGLFKHLKVSKEGEALKVGRSIRSYVRPRFTLPKARVTMPELYGLKLSGASKAKVTGFSSPHDFSLGLSGASSLDIADVSAGDIDFNIVGASRVTGDITASGNAEFNLSGASRVELVGSAKDVVIEASDASHVELGGFPVKNAKLKFKGACRGTVNMDGKLDANLSGASRLGWIGNPVMGDIKTFGASTLSKK